jgi:hypothetical protein
MQNTTGRTTQAQDYSEHPNSCRTPQEETTQAQGLLKNTKSYIAERHRRLLKRRFDSEHLNSHAGRHRRDYSSPGLTTQEHPILMQNMQEYSSKD